MNTRGLLDQLLQSGSEMMSRQKGWRTARNSAGQSGPAVGISVWRGAMNLLMSSRKARKASGNLAT